LLELKLLILLVYLQRENVLYNMDTICSSMKFLVFHCINASVKRRQLDRNQSVMRLIEIIPEIFSVEKRMLQPVSLFWRAAIHSEEALNYFSVINSHREIRGTFIQSPLSRPLWIFSEWRCLNFTMLSLFPLSAVRRNYRQLLQHNRNAGVTYMAWPNRGVPLYS